MNYFLQELLPEIIAVINIDGHKIGNGKEGPVTKCIREMYSKIVSAHIKEYMYWLTPIW